MKIWILRSHAQILCLLWVEVTFKQLGAKNFMFYVYLFGLKTEHFSSHAKHMQLAVRVPFHFVPFFILLWYSPIYYSVE